MGGDCMSKMLLNRVVSVNTFQREFDLRCVELIQGIKNKGFLQKRQILFFKNLHGFLCFFVRFFKFTEMYGFFSKKWTDLGKKTEFLEKPPRQHGNTSEILVGWDININNGEGKQITKSFLIKKIFYLKCSMDSQRKYTVDVTSNDTRSMSDSSYLWLNNIVVFFLLKLQDKTTSHLQRSNKWKLSVFS